MDVNDAYLEPVSTGPVDLPADAIPESSRQPTPSGLIRWCWQGIKLGFKGSSYLILACLLFLLPVALVPKAIGLGAGRGFGLHDFGYWVLAFSLWLAAVGMIFGLLAGFFSWGLDRIRPRQVESVDEGRGVGLRRLWGLNRTELGPEILARRRSRRRFWLVLATIPAQIILLVACGVGYYLNRDVARRLKAAIAEADADDPHWRLDDFFNNRVQIPDDENSALVVDEVVSELPELWLTPTRRDQPDPPENMKALLAAYTRISATEPNVLLDDRTTTVLRNALEEYRDAVDLARTVAGYEVGMHELLPTNNPLHMLLPQSHHVRTAARLLQIDATIRSQDGDVDGALESCSAIFGVCRSIGDEPTAISELVRTAMGHYALFSARRALALGEPSEEALARFEQAVLDEIEAPILLRACRGERASLTALISRIGSGELPISELGFKDSGPDSTSVPVDIAPWEHLVFDSQLAYGLDWTNQLVEIAKGPPAQRPTRMIAWEAMFARTKQQRFSGYLAALPLKFMPAMNNIVESESRYKSGLGATAIVFAAERHRRKTGEWPKSIEAISKEFLPRIPIDYPTGGPLLYEFREGQLLVHSVGPNLKDEHGAYDPEQLLHKKVPDDVGSGAWDVSLRRRPAPVQPKSDVDGSTPGDDSQSNAKDK